MIGGLMVNLLCYNGSHRRTCAYTIVPAKSDSDVCFNYNC